MAFLRQNGHFMPFPFCKTLLSQPFQGPSGRFHQELHVGTQVVERRAAHQEVAVRHPLAASFVAMKSMFRPRSTHRKPIEIQAKTSQNLRKTFEKL